MKVNILTPIKVVSPRGRATASDDSNVQPDLLYMRSVLVSTGQNKNDDVFLPSEMWAARSSPSLKPVNWEHRSGKEIIDTSTDPNVVIEGNQIIGCIFDCFVADKDGNKIDKTQSSENEIPENFDIIIDSVVYKYLYPKVSAKVVDGANKDELFVSMECWFNNYDYLVGSKIVARNEETAFLDRHLRAGGGDGVFAGHKVGRILRNIIFGGVGVVHKPANAGSIIQSFTNAEVIENSVEEPEDIDLVISQNTIGSIEDFMNKSTEVEKAMAGNANPTTAAPSAPENTISSEDYKGVVERLVKAEHEIELKGKELETAAERAKELETMVENLKGAFIKGSEALKEVLGDDASDKLSNAVPADWFDVLSEVVADKLSGFGENAEKLAEAQAKLEKMEIEKRATERREKIKSELGLAKTDKDDEDVAKEKASKLDELVETSANFEDTAFDSWLTSLKGLVSVTNAAKNLSKTDETDVSNEQNTLASELEILNSVTAGKNVPAGNAAAPSNVDWDKAMASLVSELVGQPSKGEDE